MTADDEPPLDVEKLVRLAQVVDEQNRRPGLGDYLRNMILSREGFEPFFDFIFDTAERLGVTAAIRYAATLAPRGSGAAFWLNTLAAILGWALGIYIGMSIGYFVFHLIRAFVPTLNAILPPRAVWWILTIVGTSYFIGWLWCLGQIGPVINTVVGQLSAHPEH